MTWRTCTAILLVGIGTTACQSPIGRGGEQDTTAVAAQATDSAVTAPAPAGTPTATPPARQPSAAQQPAASPRQPGVQLAAEEPWTPTQTGTVNPGMSRDEVITVWGPPVAERTAGDFAYLYFRNGCELACGTFDVVFLQNGQVVDAIVRGPGHTYSGQSSSPPGRPAVPTPPVTGGGSSS
ncbi:MAG: hypothetical protein OER21_09025 [Gemmatimonadota bacterium]|nr:hypothetical protein [Gemmatimonadota bacterium]